MILHQSRRSNSAVSNLDTSEPRLKDSNAWRFNYQHGHWNVTDIGETAVVTIELRIKELRFDAVKMRGPQTAVLPVTSLLGIN